MGFAGAVFGAVVSWVLTVLYAWRFEGEADLIAVPLLLTASGGVVFASKRELRTFGLGIVAGALADTLFFLWLTYSLS